jgi:superfamily II DNA or RNA helicase
VSEAQRIRLAHLFDPLLAVHTSNVEPLPHQITGVYKEMLPRQPLRYLLADDPGAGKTIMSGLFIKELIIRGDVHRCLIVPPGNLVEQWQDELWNKFHLAFDVVDRQVIETSRTGNPYSEKNLVIGRLDHIARNEEVQAKLSQTEWDLIVVDEAHKMSAHYFGNELKETKRYKLGKLLGSITRHLLLLTATPHSGSEIDFQLFMALLDSDRFEGRFRDGVHSVDGEGIMRRMVKEKLVKFDGRPLFPERKAYSPAYKLSDQEAHLYAEVTDYVREEMNRAERLAREQGEGRRGAIVGFALTTLQRRLASSPNAIYQSLRRRKERLENRLREEELRRRGEQVVLDLTGRFADLDEEDIEEIDDRPDAEIEEIEEEVVDQASAAQTVAELKAEIETLARLEALARQVRSSGRDRKWEELSDLLQNAPEMFDAKGVRRKLIIFTEHRDTLTYLEERITRLLGRPEALVTIHGGMGREERRKMQELFTQDKDVSILVATDAAGEGINLQRAHLMVNYDLPWNPNRIEQRFGRIHRIGQIEVCHMWNLVAMETREGDVFQRLFEKLERQSQSLGGQVFDILGQAFSEKSLRKLLIEAIRYGEHPEVRDRLNQIVDEVLEDDLRRLVNERALASDVMTSADVEQIRIDMEKAEARRLQPHYIRSFFIEAFRHLGGRITEREPGRFEITHVPADIRGRDRLIGVGQPILRRYERVTFEKELMRPQGQSPADFVAPGHPLLDATIDLILERYRPLLKKGAVLIAPDDPLIEPRVLVYLEHAIQDGRATSEGSRRVVSKRMQFVEMDEEGNASVANHAPYLDYRPLEEKEPDLVVGILNQGWITGDLERTALDFGIGTAVPEHLEEVRRQTLYRVDKTAAAVRDRLTKEIAYWDHLATELKEQELAGKKPKRTSGWARQKADDLEDRMKRRLQELELQKQLSPLPPRVTGAAIVIPAALLGKLKGAEISETAKEVEEIERRAVDAVLRTERTLGRVPEEMPRNNPGYDVLSKDPNTGQLLFIEVKGRVEGAPTVTITKTEILTAKNKQESYILALVGVGDSKEEVRYARDPFTGSMEDLHFATTSVTFDWNKMFAVGKTPN